ncbi:hypothetical protein [Aporhodopirellula aestuarii]|uniref:Uncharacterized protein n=1 Tax=Aporhodopirellula aestuarii TaxID=2950107 RepID=A0ABT0U1E4_9BACT|nr:hypothetical protein [Aporhodopirellula aestuarii]MCM2370375.1 hypothetical protein [Aporhodopirellula aestuarii]
MVIGADVSLEEGLTYLGGPVDCEHWLRHLSFLGQEHDLNTPEGREREALELQVLSRRLHSNGTAMSPEKLLRCLPDMRVYPVHLLFQSFYRSS